jgi:hypothetical protein
MISLFAVATVYAALVLQTSLVPRYSLDAPSPDLVLAVALAWAAWDSTQKDDAPRTARGRHSDGADRGIGTLAAFCGGLAMDALSPGPIGVRAAVYAAAAAVVQLGGGRGPFRLPACLGLAAFAFGWAADLASSAALPSAVRSSSALSLSRQAACAGLTAAAALLAHLTGSLLRRRSWSRARPRPTLAPLGR